MLWSGSFNKWNQSKMCFGGSAPKPPKPKPLPAAPAAPAPPPAPAAAPKQLQAPGAKPDLRIGTARTSTAGRQGRVNAGSLKSGLSGSDQGLNI